MTPVTVTERQAVREGRGSRAVRIALGAVLLLLVLLPVYRLLDPEQTGRAGRYTRDLLDIYYEFAWAGLLLVVPIAILAGRLWSPEGLARVSAAIRGMLCRHETKRFVLACGGLGAILTAVFSLLVLEGKPNMLDAFVQALQARYWAAGILAGPVDGNADFWAVQNALFTSNGWVSQYPPGHIALLVPFFWIGQPWLIGPVLVCITILSAGFFTHRLLPHDQVVARLGTLLLSISPFFLFIGASLMNHITTAACVTFGAYALLRAWQDDARWAAAAGIALALSLATRPLSTLAMGMALAVTIAVLWPQPLSNLLRVAAAGLLGAAPILALWLSYNQYFFGSPFRLGYDVAMGPSMGLGFRQDPWGNPYGPLEALAYTSSDLITLGVNLFETPLSALLVIGVFLLVAPRISRSVWLLIAWAVAPVLANVFYWHHGLNMGPRMLHEATPAWVLLFSAATIGLLRRIPSQLALANRYFVRPAVAATLMAAFAIGIVFLAPQRAISYAGAHTPLPDPHGRSLVFVHDAWIARLAMSLAPRGMRLDLIETIIRQNPTCRVDEFVGAVITGDAARVQRSLAELDTIPRPDRLPPQAELAKGDFIRIAPGEVLTPECRRQALSDRFGILDIAPLLWQTELHGAPGDGPLIARDLGPERNTQLIAAYPNRTPYLYIAADSGARLLPYEQGIQSLWFPPDTVGLHLRGQERVLE